MVKREVSMTGMKNYFNGKGGGICRNIWENMYLLGT